MLSELCLRSTDLFAEGVSAEFCEALQGARLSFLNLGECNLLLSTEGGLAVLEALTGHPTLRVLSACANTTISLDAKLAVGAALGSLVSVQSALETLICWSLGLGDDALRPLFAAVAQSTTLRTLDCNDNDISQDFARDVVLPAVRSNTSLRELLVAERGHIAELMEAEALVKARAA
jgi:hypothetical protein